jgi:hypothetical protein
MEKHKISGACFNIAFLTVAYDSIFTISNLVLWPFFLRIAERLAIPWCIVYGCPILG